jgi:PAS domain S-box-containing protein
LAYFLARSDEGMVSIAVSNSNSAFLLRTLIPVIIGVPILIGWLMLAGERANLYDKPFAIALMVLGCIACLSGITLLIIRSMDRLEWEESRVKEAARESEERQTAILRSRESLLSTFVQNVPAGVAMLDLDMRYIQVSDRWCADYGLESSQILGTSHYEIFPDVPERWKEAHRRALAGETVRADEDHWDRKDDPRWVRWELRSLEISNWRCWPLT